MQEEDERRPEPAILDKQDVEEISLCSKVGRRMSQRKAKTEEERAWINTKNNLVHRSKAPILHQAAKAVLTRLSRLRTPTSVSHVSMKLSSLTLVGPGVGLIQLGAVLQLAGWRLTGGRHCVCISRGWRATLSQKDAQRT